MIGFVLRLCLLLKFLPDIGKELVQSRADRRRLWPSGRDAAIHGETRDVL